MKTTPIYKLIGFMAILFIMSCIREDIYRPAPPADRDVTFELITPRVYATPGNGLTNTEEREINDLSILLFQTNSGGNEECVQIFTGITPAPVSGTENAKYKINITVPAGRYKFMLIANLPGAFTPSTIGMEYDDIAGSLLYTMTAKWKVDDHHGFPMWGISDDFLDTQADASFQQTILMLRMMARINLNVDEPLRDDFKLTAIRLHNPSGRGRVIPDENNLDRTTTPGYIRAIAPTLPLNNANQPDPGMLNTPWEYSGTTEIGEEAWCYNQIYSMESFDPKDRNDNEYAWLEIDATYKDMPEATFRIDFGKKDTEGNKTRMPLLRNHTYDITITGVNNEENITLDITIIEWNDADPRNVIFDGDYLLAVNPTIFNINRESKTYSFLVETNHESWDFKLADDHFIESTHKTPDTGAGTDGNIIGKLDFTVGRNDTGDNRDTKIIVTAGNLSMDVSIRQTPNDTPFQFRVTDKDITDPSAQDIEILRFHSGREATLNKQEFWLNWAPEEILCVVTEADRINQFTYLYEYDEGGTGTNDYASSAYTEMLSDREYLHTGKVRVTIHPPVMTDEEIAADRFLVKEKSLSFMLVDPPNYQFYPLTLQQVNYDIYTGNQRVKFRTGRTYHIRVVSNTPWICTLDRNPGELFDPFEITGTTSSANNQVFTGGGSNDGKTQVVNEIQFKVKNDFNLYGEQVNLRITSSEPGTKPARTITMPLVVDAAIPNSYIVKTGRSQTISLKHVYQFWNEQGVDIRNHTHSFELVWQDSISALSSLNGSNSLNPTNPTVSVTAGSVPGNAVVALRTNNEIRWSWHIWVLKDEDEQDIYNNRIQNGNYYFMDRELGSWQPRAHITDRSEVDDPSQGYFGLFYQWGRKDPFPPPPDLEYTNVGTVNTSNNRKKLYDNLGGTSSFFMEPQYISVTEENNLLYSIHNPEVFLMNPGTGSTRDWYTDNPENLNDYLWNTEDNDKGYYDPCPDGWRVPYNEWENTSNNTPFTGTTYADERFPFVHTDSDDPTLSGFARMLDPLGYIPLVGYQFYNTGLFMGIKVTNRQWAVIPTRGSAQVWNEQLGYGTPNGFATNGGGSARGNGFNVRCIRENQNPPVIVIE